MSGDERRSMVDHMFVKRALAAADAEVALRDQAKAIEGDLKGVESITLIAVGKAAAGMVRGAGVLHARVRDGVVVIPSGASGQAANVGPLAKKLEVVRGDHPKPSALSVAAGDRVEAAVRAASGVAGRAVVLLISGGASALMAAPRAGVTAADVAAVADALMRAGAGIDELNTVRRRLDRLKGGGLARLAAPAKVFTYAISDVLGDDLRVIGSGPGVADDTSDADALGVLASRGVLGASEPVRAVLRAGVVEEAPPAPVTNVGAARVVLNNGRMIETLRRDLASVGEVVEVHLGVRGEAREAAWVMVERLREIAAKGKPRTEHARPHLVLWGGETTVTVRGGGQGGRNQEFALAAALASVEQGKRPGLPLEPPRILVLSFGTDGIDGTTEVAGAFVTDETATMCRTLGLDARAALDANDSNTLLSALQARGEPCLVRTGPTGANVNDVMLGVVWA